MKKLPHYLSATMIFVLCTFAVTLGAAENTGGINVDVSYTNDGAKDTSDIYIEVNYADYVNFTGTAVGASKYYTVDDIKPAGSNRRGPRVNLGTLGLESNSVVNCTIDFSSKNNFKLRHLVSNKKLTRYRLRYKKKNITKKRNRQRVLSCNTAATKLQFQAIGNFKNNPQAGVYQDIVTITVTTQ